MSVTIIKIIHVHIIKCMYYIVRKANIRNRYNQVLYVPETLYGKVTKTQGDITQKIAKWSALSQHVITRLDRITMINMKRKCSKTCVKRPLSKRLKMKTNYCSLVSRLSKLQKTKDYVNANRLTFLCNNTGYSALRL